MPHYVANWPHSTQKTRARETLLLLPILAPFPPQEDALVVYTLVDPKAVKAVQTACKLQGVRYVDLWSELLDNMEVHLNAVRRWGGAGRGGAGGGRAVRRRPTKASQGQIGAATGKERGGSRGRRDGSRERRVRGVLWWPVSSCTRPKTADVF